MNNFIIGTANFTQGYGSSNSCLDKAEVIAILEDALMSGICELDTAEIYGNLERVVPHSLLNNFTIRTKLIVESDSNFERNCDSILRKFQTIDAVLIHNAEDLPLDILGEKLQIMKSYLNEARVGVSIYNNVDILKLRGIESIQVPHNILNMPLNMIPKNQFRGLEVIVRSVFLQGVLLKERSFEDANFNVIREYIRLIAASYKLTPVQFLLALVKSKNLRPVLGFRNLAQFQEIKSFYKSLPNIEDDYRIITKSTIYDPRLWRKK